MFARRHGFLDEACKHMQRKSVLPNFFADYERCKSEAAKYQTRTEFHLKSCSAYDHALANGWLDEICAHMPPPQGVPRNYWNEETVRAEALKFTTRTEFEEHSSGAIDAARKLGILDDVCSHMVSAHKLPSYGEGRTYWTRERCKEAAREFATRTEFQIGSRSAYNRALQDGFLDEICQHMRPAGHNYRRALYAYEFVDKSVYVGLTYDYEQRHQQHLTDTRKRLWKKFQTTLFKLVKFNVWMDKNSAKLEEEKLVETYKTSGWTILNRIRAGGLGGTTRKWFKNTCAKEAKKYRTRSAFIKGSSGAYDAAKDNGWLDEICGHMQRLRVRKWTRDKLLEEAKKYSMLKDFREQAAGAYERALKDGLLDEICGHMKRARTKQPRPPE